MEKKVLIVDDEFNSRTPSGTIIPGRWLQRRDSGKRKCRLKILEDTTFDILIVDIRMPIMDGIELFHRVKELYPHMPVIFFTAYGTIEAAVTALKEGAFHHLEKPVNFDLLKHTVEQALDIKKLEAEIINLKKQLAEKKT